MVAHFGLEVVNAYMGHVQDNAAEQVRRSLDGLRDDAFAYEILAAHRQPETLAALAQDRAIDDDSLQNRTFLQRIALPIASAVDDHEPPPGVGAVDVDIEMQRRKAAAGARGERIQ
jgi:hypothetical protein